MKQETPPVFALTELILKKYKNLSIGQQMVSQWIGEKNTKIVVALCETKRCSSDLQGTELAEKLRQLFNLKFSSELLTSKK